MSALQWLEAQSRARTCAKWVQLTPSPEWSMVRQQEHAKHEYASPSPQRRRPNGSQITGRPVTPVHSSKSHGRLLKTKAGFYAVTMSHLDHPRRPSFSHAWFSVTQEATGMKYEAAISPEWNGSIKVVHSRWLQQSHARNRKSLLLSLVVVCGCHAFGRSCSRC